MAAPARLLLDAHRPLAPLLSDAGAALGPLMRALGWRTFEDLERLVDDDAGMERVIAALDAAGERNAEPG
jgi:hypothetical protein